MTPSAGQEELTQPEFGARLRSLRERAGKSQADLASPGLSKSSVSLIESGHRKPSPRMVTTLAQALGVDVELLRTGVDASSRDAEELQLRLALLTLRSGDPRGARDALEALLAALPPGSDSRVAAEHALANADEQCGDLEAAVLRLERLRRDAEADPRRHPWLHLTIDLARCYKEAGDLHRAVDVAERALARARSLGLDKADDFPRLAVTLAGASRERGDHAHARAILQQLLEDLGPAGSRRGRASALWNSAVVAGERGEHREGILLAERALALFEDEDDARAHGVLRTVMAWMLLETGDDPAQALALLHDAHARLSALGRSVDVAYAETELARACTQLGEHERAVAWARSALARLGQGGLESARARLALAGALLDNGEREAALYEMARGAEALESLDATRQAAAAWRDLAELYVALGDHASAHDAYRRVTRQLGLPVGRRAGVVPAPSASELRSR